MARWKYVPISKKAAQEVPCGLPYLIGLWVLRMVKKGYYRFEFEETKEHFIIRALRSKRLQAAKEAVENE